MLSLSLSLPNTHDRLPGTHSLAVNHTVRLRLLIVPLLVMRYEWFVIVNSHERSQKCLVVLQFGWEG
eukprot:m.167197 g.167197  ORF g.167197 m.167197 type:complete len:67 (-) comp18186_c0_seq1:210-410(-)